MLSYTLNGNVMSILQDNTFSSNVSTNTVLHITPPRSHRSATLPPSSVNGNGSSQYCHNGQHQHQSNGQGAQNNQSDFNHTDSTTTLNAGNSFTFTAASSSTAFASAATTGQLHSRGTSLGQRNTFSRPLGNSNASRCYHVTLLDGEAMEIPLKVSY